MQAYPQKIHVFCIFLGFVFIMHLFVSSFSPHHLPSLLVLASGFLIYFARGRIQGPTPGWCRSLHRDWRFFWVRDYCPAGLFICSREYRWSLFNLLLRSRVKGRKYLNPHHYCFEPAPKSFPGGVESQDFLLTQKSLTLTLNTLHLGDPGSVVSPGREWAFLLCLVAFPVVLGLRVKACLSLFSRRIFWIILLLLIFSIYLIYLHFFCKKLMWHAGL